LISIFYALFFGGKKEEIHFSPDGFMWEIDLGIRKGRRKIMVFFLWGNSFIRRVFW
jgi:hypothetical protein